MKLIKTASGKTQIKMSRKEWTSIGKKAGWGRRIDTGPFKAIKFTDQDCILADLGVEVNEVEYNVSVKIHMAFDEGQEGGYSDPSWPAHYTVEYGEIESIDGNVTYSQELGVRIEPIVDSQMERYEDELSDYAMEAAEERRI